MRVLSTIVPLLTVHEKSRRTTLWLVVKRTVLVLHVTLVLQLDVLLLDWALGIVKTKNYIRSGEFHN